MAKYIVKSRTGNFEETRNTLGFRPIIALENRFFVCEAEEMPMGEFAVEFPTEQQTGFMFYPYPNGKRLFADVFNGSVQFSEDVDTKNRRAIMYTPQQLQQRLEFVKWVALNVWLPDRTRTESLSPDVVDSIISGIQSCITDVDAVNFVKSNLYYDL